MDHAHWFARAGPSTSSQQIASHYVQQGPAAISTFHMDRNKDDATAARRAI